jgi:hypothetical protein
LTIIVVSLFAGFDTFFSLLFLTDLSKATRGSPQPVSVIAHLAQIGRVVLENSIIYQRMGG